MRDYLLAVGLGIGFAAMMAYGQVFASFIR